MLIKPQYIPVVIVAWLIAAGFIIIPRLIKKKPVSANTTHGDIVNAIMGLQNAIYTAMGIQMCVIITMMALLLNKK